MLINHTSIKEVVKPSETVTVENWISDHVGSNNANKGQITVFDFSLVPYEILHLVLAVAARLIFEALQRYKHYNKENLPTVLVLEEAHTFVSQQYNTREELPTPAEMCLNVFNRIAREGRKFGLGLVLSSQRPSELSETILSQCNTFLLHRITNERDQQLVGKLVPDNARGILRELPSLPTKQSLLLGLASELPVLIDVPHLQPEDRPSSDDPKFWEVWTGIKPSNINWSDIVNEWLKMNNDDIKQ